MPVLSIKPADESVTVERHCARCGAVSDVDGGALVLGAGRNMDAIQLPACGGCGAVETLFRTFDHVPAAMSKHRRAVNALASWLKNEHKLNTELAAAIEADERSPGEASQLFVTIPPLRGLPEPIRA